MKKIYILVLSIISVSAVNAQITLTAANNNPSVGDSFTSHTFDGTTFNPGSAGPNVTWDFSSLVIQSTSVGTIVAPSTFVEGVSHPMANAASGDANSQGYLFIDGDEFSMAGAFIPGTLREVQTDVREFYKFPITFSTPPFNETFDGTIDNLAVSQVFDRGGTIIIEADAYGTLILPYGTVNNVLRIKTTTDFTDSQGGIPLLTYNEVRYSWFNAGSKAPILSHDLLTPSIGGPITVANYLDQADVVTGLGDDFVQNTPILVYPNPATDQVNISLDRIYRDPTIKIVDVTGKIVKIQQLENGTKNVSFQLTELDKGIYFVQIYENNNIISTEKLMIN